MSCWNVAGALINPKVRVTNWRNQIEWKRRFLPRHPVSNKSESHLTKMSGLSMSGIGYASNLDTAFTFLTSTQNWPGNQDHRAGVNV